MTKSIVSFEKADTLPAHLSAGSQLGSENVSASDMTIPMLKLAQVLSPECTKTNAKFIAGLDIGHIFNHLTGDYHDSLNVVNLKFETGFTIFKDRKLGGGFEGNHESMAAALQHLEEHALHADQHEITETAVHYVGVLDDNGQNPKLAKVYMSKSNKKVSDGWNTELAGKAADRFATVWNLSSVTENSSQGQPYQVFKPTLAGWAGEDLYKECRATYFAMKGIADPTATH